MKDTLQLHNLTTGYAGHSVTRDIDASLRSCELTCLLGPNGAGKSTLLKTLCGFIPALGGEILLDGVPLQRYKSRQLARKVGVVLTERPTAPDMTVAELVAIGRTPYTSFLGSLTAADSDIVDRSLALVGIESLRHRRLHSLSDGECQKAFIAKALAQQTSVVILDEPTAFLDFPSKVEVMKLLSRIAREEDKTVFLSTHDISLALQLADSLWLLDRQTGLHAGTPAQLASDGSLSRSFDTPGMRFDPASLSFIISRD